jgi:hypothetical protein
MQLHAHAERRVAARGGPGNEPDRPHLVSQVIGTYSEMPGLLLTLPQAARLFGVRRTTCAVIFDELVRCGRLRRTPENQFALPS